ncbi:MAG: hypothetical protein CMP67_08680 [Flavobacteriales bacterium]|nr:hypothetical protein [Flavobacteriales bacterium]|tara:strand:+ start:243 stop:746 length:504 start_codon:yes stop_codon:yes gene_type:complete
MRKTVFTLLLLTSFGVSAQYINSFGVRGGLRGVGLTYKHYLAPKLFLNVDGVGTYSQELQGGEVFAMMNIRNKIHNTFFQSKELTWSYGGGLHAGYYQDPDNTNYESNIVLGPDLRLGAEYLFRQKICIGADANLFYNVMPVEKIDGMDEKYYQFFSVGVFLRYVLN